MLNYLSESFGINRNLFDLGLRILLRIILFSIYIIIAFFSWKIALGLFLLDIAINTFINYMALRKVDNLEYLLDFLRIHFNQVVE